MDAATTIRLDPPPDPAAEVRGIVAGTIERHGMLRPGERVLSGFSGGPDSTALALLLVDLGYDVVLGHVDHGMRPESAADAEHCRRFAGAWGLEIEVDRVRVEPPTEAEARRVRYLALARMAARAGAAKVATGHTLDDQAETVLMRLARGGYPMGIRPVRGILVRPLLGVKRVEARAFCRLLDAGWLDDPSNLDESRTRNLLRHGALAALGEEAVARLALVGEAGRLAAARTGEVVGRLSAEIVRWEEGPRAEIDRERLAVLPPSTARALIRSVLGGFGVEPSFRVLADVLEKVVPRTGARLDLPGGWAAWCEPAAVLVGRDDPAAPPPPFDVAVPGCTRSPAWGIEVLVEELPIELLRPAPEEPGGEAVMDPGAVDGPLMVRSRLPGDRYRPLGAPGSRKLQDLLVDLKVPRRLRDRVPVLCCGERIVWVAGHRIDEALRLPQRARTALRVRILPLPSPGTWPLAGGGGRP